MATPFPFKTKYVSPLPLVEGWGGASFKENKKGKELFLTTFPLVWSHLGSNQGPIDYESTTLTN